MATSDHTLVAAGGKSLDEKTNSGSIDLNQVEELDTSTHASKDKWNWVILPKTKLKTARYGLNLSKYIGPWKYVHYNRERFCIIVTI